MTRILAALSLLTSVGVVAVPAATPPAEEVVTFFATSDSHYEALQNVDRNDRNKSTLERMNALPGTSWPEKLGGGAIGKPRGVLALGDLIDDGDKKGESEIEWRAFEKQFGLDGTDGVLKYPVFEGWGNHDGPPIGREKFGFSTQSQIKRRNMERKSAGRIAHVAENGLHYSWDWGPVHFVQTNLYPANKQHPKVRYSLPWHDPQGALTFLAEDLKTSVGETGRPVIVMSHCGVDTDWWHADDWAAFYKEIKPYNVIAFFYGHSGTGLRKFKPEGEDKPIDCVNTGQTEKGFFVAEVSPQRFRVAYQVKKDPKVTNAPEWEWKYMLEKPLAPAKETPAKP